MSKMQPIIDRAREAATVCDPNSRDAVEALIEAVILLAKAQQQLMSRVDSDYHSRTDILIGGDNPVQ